MYDAKDLLKVIKQAAVEAVEASNPVTVCMGTIQSVSPLTIKTGQKLILSEKQLFTGKEIEGLKKSDKVILLREQGGQKYIVLGVI